MTKVQKCDVKRIRQVISGSRPTRDWLILDEFPLDAGMRSVGTPRIDLLAIKVGNGGGYGSPLLREAYEIKVSRPDFLNELRRPAKRRKAYAVCDHYYFAVPEGLVTEDEVPPECGLKWVSSDLAVPIQMREAKQLQTEPPSPLFMMDVARRAYQVGLRHGAATCALEHFESVCKVAYFSIRNRYPMEDRMKAVQALSTALSGMQRHEEAAELMRIANGYEVSDAFGWVLPTTLQSNRDGKKLPPRTAFEKTTP